MATSYGFGFYTPTRPTVPSYTGPRFPAVGAIPKTVFTQPKVKKPTSALTGTTTQGQPGSPAEPVLPDLSSYSADPALAQVRALANLSIGGSVAEGDVARKKALTQLGDPALARSTTFGAPAINFSDPSTGESILSTAGTEHVGDEATAIAAQQNPMSTLAQLLKNHQLRQEALTQALARANLGFSSTRGRKEQEEGEQYLGEQSSARSAVGDILSGITSQIRAAQQTQIDAAMRAYQEAQMRALMAALARGSTGSTGGGGGGGGGVSYAPAASPQQWIPVGNVNYPISDTIAEKRRRSGWGPL